MLPETIGVGALMNLMNFLGTYNYFFENLKSDLQKLTSPTVHINILIHFSPTLSAWNPVTHTYFGDENLGRS